MGAFRLIVVINLLNRVLSRIRVWAAAMSCAKKMRLSSESCPPFLTTQNIIDISKLPDHVIEKICRYLIDDTSSLCCFIFPIGLLHVLRLSATCVALREKVSDSRLFFYIRLDDWDKLNDKKSPWEMLKYIHDNFKLWKCNYISIGLDRYSLRFSVEKFALDKLENDVLKCIQLFDLAKGSVRILIVDSGNFRFRVQFLEKIATLLASAQYVTMDGINSGTTQYATVKYRVSESDVNNLELLVQNLTTLEPASYVRDKKLVLSNQNFSALMSISFLWNNVDYAQSVELPPSCTTVKIDF